MDLVGVDVFPSIHDQSVFFLHLVSNAELTNDVGEVEGGDRLVGADG